MDLGAASALATHLVLSLPSPRTSPLMCPGRTLLGPRWNLAHGTGPQGILRPRGLRGPRRASWTGRKCWEVSFLSIGWGGGGGLGRGCLYHWQGRHSTPRSSQPEPAFVLLPTCPGVIAGGLVGLIFAVCLVGFMLYRMKKKDEGSYSLEEPKQANGGAYQKPTKQEEFYA